VIFQSDILNGILFLRNTRTGYSLYAKQDHDQTDARIHANKIVLFLQILNVPSSTSIDQYYHEALSFSEWCMCMHAGLHIRRTHHQREIYLSSRGLSKVCRSRVLQTFPNLSTERQEPSRFNSGSDLIDSRILS
jgi:hypothetical protein